MLKNASLLAIVAVDTAENEPSEVGDADLSRSSVLERRELFALVLGELCAEVVFDEIGEALRFAHAAEVGICKL